MTRKHGRQSSGVASLVLLIIIGIVLLLSWGVFWWSAFQIAMVGRYRQYFISGGVSFLASIVCMILQERIRRSALRKTYDDDLEEEDGSRDEENDDHSNVYDENDDHAYYRDDGDDSDDAEQDDYYNNFDEDERIEGIDENGEFYDKYENGGRYEGDEDYENDSGDSYVGYEEAEEAGLPVQEADHPDPPFRRTHLALRIVEGILIGVVAAAGVAGIVWAATPYNGWLSLKLHDLSRVKTTTYHRNNLYTDGIEGIFTDLSSVAELPATDTLYIVGQQTINYDMDGTITSIHMLLAGRNEEGIQERYTISYNADQDENITIETDIVLEDDEDQEAASSADADTGPQTVFTSSMILQPFIDLSKAMDLSGESLAYENASGQNKLQLIYYGYRSFAANEYTYYISQDGTRTHVSAATDDSAAKTNSQDAAGTSKDQAAAEVMCEGYEISLHSSGVDEIVPARYFATWKYQERE